MAAYRFFNVEEIDWRAILSVHIKESVRWVQGYERLAEMASQLLGTRLVVLTDR